MSGKSKGLKAYAAFSPDTRSHAHFFYEAAIFAE